MDPDANLAEQLKLAEEIQHMLDPPNVNSDKLLHFIENKQEMLQALCDKANRLTDLIQGLDNWMRMHGAPPKRWAR